MRELGLTIVGTPLEPILADFQNELRAAGIEHVRPRFYLSTEWGVPWKTVAIAIPFYLVDPQLAAEHADRTGLVEGTDREDILRYLRHEMGHVMNYAYQLYERSDWVNIFGSITQPYEEEYRPRPWSTRYVRHLPGWYAQKHPDEDWAETFAVWMTPGHEWRVEYATWPGALAKLEYADALIAEVRGRKPLVSDDELDEHVADIEYSLDGFYLRTESALSTLPAGFDGALRAVFPEQEGAHGALAASQLMRTNLLPIVRAVFTWTGHFPEDTRSLIRHLEERATQLKLAYTPQSERVVLTAFTVLVTSLAMNHVHGGSYIP